MHRRPLVLVSLSVVLLAPLLGPAVGATATAAPPPTVSGANPGDVAIGGTTQTVHLGGRLPAGNTTLTLDVTPLAEAGVDLSAATVAANRSTAGVDADAALERAGGRVLVRAALRAREGESGFRLALRLRGLETAGAEAASLRYDGRLGESAFETDAFRLEPPGMPTVVAEPDGVPPVLDRRAETLDLRLAVDDAPGETPVRLHLDLAPLRRANVSLDGLAASAEPTEPGTTLGGVETNGSVVTVRAGTDGEPLAELDTRGAEPAPELRLPLTVEVPAGTKTVQSLPLGLYRPGEAPTPTETVVESPTATPGRGSSRSATPATSPTPAAGQPGFSVAVALLALVLAVALRRRRRG